MSDPTMDLGKLKAVRDWTEDLADELKRTDVLPCKNVERLGDCIARQARFLVPEMKPSKMCSRCKCRWHVMMAINLMGTVYSAKTERVLDAVPSFS